MTPGTKIGAAGSDVNSSTSSPFAPPTVATAGWPSRPTVVVTAGHGRGWSSRFPCTAGAVPVGTSTTPGSRTSVLLPVIAATLYGVRNAAPARITDEPPRYTIDCVMEMPGAGGASDARANVPLAPPSSVQFARRAALVVRLRAGVVGCAVE